MKNKFLRQLFELAATVLACAIVSIGNFPPTPPAVGNTGNGLIIENQGSGEGIDEEPGISPQNDKDRVDNAKLD